jgi:LPXTG-motif cell wall-anchored protein
VVDRLHYFFEMLEPETLRIVELHIISNPSNLTVVPDEESQTTIAFDLPENASNLEILDSNIGERFVMTESGFADTFPIQPGEGENQVVFAYDLPFDGRLEFSRPVNLLTNAVVILIPEDGISVKGSDISDGGTRDVEGMPYHIYNGGGLLPGEEFRIMISGNDTLSFLGVTGDDNTNLLLGIGIFGIVLVAAGVWFYLRSKSKPEDEDEALETQTEVELNGIEDSETAMDAILALDDLYKEGQLPEEAYLERRAELKSHLKQLIEREAQDN